jgi:uncharacterized protein YkwD
VVTPPVVESQYQPIITNPPAAPVYASATDSVNFNRLNHDRSICGFGYVRQSVQLDAAAKGHAVYLTVNNLQNGHTEAVGSPTYAPDQRAKLAGYNGPAAGEVVAGLNQANPLYSIKGLFAAPYHASNILGGVTEVGIGSQASTLNSGGSLVMNLGRELGEKEQKPSADTVLTYPCQGITDTQTFLSNEVPSPVPNRDIFVNFVGHPIYVKTLTALTVKTATVTGPSGSVALLPFMTSLTDPNKILETNEVVILPDNRLAVNTDYSVVITGTTNGKDFTKSFTFRTGAI